MKKNTQEQLEFRELVINKFEPKIKLFRLLSNEEKNIKLENVMNTITIELNSIEHYIEQLKNAKHPRAILAFNEKLNPHIDKLFIYCYCLLRYKEIFNNNFLKTRELCAKSQYIFKQLKYLIYASIFYNINNEGPSSTE